MRVVVGQENNTPARWSNNRRGSQRASTKASTRAAGKHAGSHAGGAQTGAQAARQAVAFGPARVATPTRQAKRHERPAYLPLEIREFEHENHKELTMMSWNSPPAEAVASPAAAATAASEAFMLQ